MTCGLGLVVLINQAIAALRHHPSADVIALLAGP